MANILLVEDDALAREMTGAILEDAGHRVETAPDALAAAEVLARGAVVDLIVCDMHMPGPTGLAFFRSLRDGGSTLPFILLTGDDPDPFLAQEGRLAGCLRKDFDLDVTLGEAVDLALAGFGLGGAHGRA
jgi:CheY-like chemotaxis protein